MKQAPNEDHAKIRAAITVARNTAGYAPAEAIGQIVAAVDLLNQAVEAQEVNLNWRAEHGRALEELAEVMAAPADQLRGELVQAAAVLHFAIESLDYERTKA